MFVMATGPTCLLFNPLSNIQGTVFELDAIGFTARQKPHSFLADERYVLQIQNNLVIGRLQRKKLLEFPNIFRLNSAAQCE
jgi:hypothetical protein